MKGNKSLSIFLIALMAFGMLIVSVPFTSGFGFPPITVDGDLSDWDALQALNKPNSQVPLEYTGDTESWSTTFATVSQGSTGAMSVPEMILNDKARDLKALYAWFDDNGDMFFRIDVASLYAGWNAGNASLYHLYIDTDDNNLTGSTTGLNACDIAVNGWEIVIYYDGITGFVMDNTLTVLADTGATGGMTAAFAVGTPGSIEIFVDRTKVGLGAIDITSFMAFSFKPGEPGYVFDPDAPGTNGIGVGAGDQADEFPDGVTNLPTVPTKTLGGADLRLDMSVGARIEVLGILKNGVPMSPTLEDMNSSAWAIGDNFTVAIAIFDAYDLSGYALDVEWDPAMIEGVSGSFAVNATFLTGAIGIAPDVDNASGKLTTPAGYAKPSGGNSGNGWLFQLKFTVMTSALGAYSWINITNYGIADSAYIGVAYVHKNALWAIPKPPMVPPTCSFDETAGPYFANVTQIVFTDTSVAGNNGTHGTPIVSWFWDFDDGTNSTDQNPTHIYNVSTALLPTSFTVNLTITDSIGRTASETAVKDVIEEPKGDVIDVFTETPRAYGYFAYTIGLGPNQTADAYQIDENVTLFAYVVHNEWPLQDRLVAWEVWDADGNNVLGRTTLTNASGIATITFRIRTVCGNREDAWGKWKVLAKTTVAKKPINDTLYFDCGDYIDLISVVTESEWAVGDPEGEHMNFTITLINIAQNPRNVTIVVTVYDDLGVPIGKIYLVTTIPGGVFCDPYVDVIFMECLVIPKWAYVGPNAMVYVSAFTDWPYLCGVPYCEEVSTGFSIVIP